MTNSENATSKCFSGILHRLLCTGSLPTHPSDHFAESITTVQFDLPKEKALKVEIQVQAPSTPGIVARLMGLDSLPDINWVEKERSTLGSILRSRSVNFVDHWPQFDPAQTQHRRVRTSVSFREVPTCLDQQKHDFFVPWSEEVSATNEKAPNARKPEVDFQEEVKQKKVERSENNVNIREKMPVRKKENQESKKTSCKIKEDPKRVIVKPSSTVDSSLHHKKNAYRKSSATLKVKSSVKPMTSGESSIGSKVSKKKQNRYAAKKVETECNLENSNSVSATGLGVSATHPAGASISGDSGLKGLNSRKKSSQKMSNWDHPCPNLVRKSNSTGDQELRTINNKADDMPIKTSETDYYTNLLGKVCSLTEEDLHKSSWVARDGFKFDDFEEICLEFGQKILELLLTQVVDELVVLHRMKYLAS